MVLRAVGFKGDRITGNEVGRMVAKIGRAAGIETDTDNGKFATCHDLRQPFGNRWATELMPADLKKMMRHRSIETTMVHYVGQDSDALSARLHEKFLSVAPVVTGKVTTEVTK